MYHPKNFNKSEQTARFRKFLATNYPSLITDLCIVDLATQTMFIKYINGLDKVYLISTALKGANNKINSFGTPLGKHIICEKIGENALIYTIFQHRKATGKIYNHSLRDDFLAQDLILTRILRLQGTEGGINLGYNKDHECVDSYDRYIYIHGTNREDLLGTPASNGCIRMANQDLIELFRNIKLGAAVHIYREII